MLSTRKFFFTTVVFEFLGCRAHWRLTKPVPRVGDGIYENNPLASNTGEDWVCRHPNPNPNVQRPTFRAGQAFQIEYGGGATFGHVGDCAVYISHDTERPRRTMRWVKIANLPDCRAQINTEVPIILPAELPGGDAVLRWEQLALHQGTFIEWFLQCADIIIDSSSTRSWESFKSFSMIDNNGVPAHPADIRLYRRNTAVPGDSDFFMSGPACVDDSINQCALTASHTQGYTGFGADPAPPTPPTYSLMPTPASTTAIVPPTPPDVYPTPSTATTTSVAPPTAPPAESDAECCYFGGCASYGSSNCNRVGSWCSQSAENCQTCAGTYCSEMDWWDTQPSSTSTSEPSAASQCCLFGGCGSATCIDGGSWCSESRANCKMCQGSYCSSASLLSKSGVRKRSFLHTRQGELALMQANLTIHEGLPRPRRSGEL